MIEVNAVPALRDNYIWIVSRRDNPRVAVVDPGEAGPVLDHLARHELSVGAYLITHHHGDHVGGLDALLARHPAPVYGPRAEADGIAGLDHPLAEGDSVALDWLDWRFTVIDVPGHTLGHIAFYGDGILLAGDALFRAGCGRVFEGSHAQMQVSLAKLRDLPEATRVYAGHEYTLKNLAFARQVEPDNRDIASATKTVEALRAAGQPSLPGTVGEERRTNPFLRWDAPRVRDSASRRAGRELRDPASIFEVLRDWKDAS